MRHRFTLKKLKELTIREMLLILIQERKSDLDGVSPLSKALLHIDGIVRNKKDLDQKIGYGEKFA
jgi:hypothetical protein